MISIFKADFNYWQGFPILKETMKNLKDRVCAVCSRSAETPSVQACQCRCQALTGNTERLLGIRGSAGSSPPNDKYCRDTALFKNPRKAGHGGTHI